MIEVVEDGGGGGGGGEGEGGRGKEEGKTGLTLLVFFYRSLLLFSIFS